jgi:dephospho-CoA kinase
MRVYGLTGGIASGKTTVAKMFAALGVPIVDADQVARDVVEPGRPAYDDIVATFGEGVLVGRRAGAPIDRKALGAIVFGDDDKRRKLNAITHPRIAAESQARLAAFAAAGHPVALYEAALLVENGLHRALPGLVVVAVDEETQVARTCARDGVTPEEARARIRAQAPLADKIAAATWVIDTRGTLDEVRAQVERVYQEMTKANATHG